MPDTPPRPDTPPDDEPLPAAVVLGGAVLLTALLSIWAGFLVPLRVGDLPLPVWLVPLGAMLAVAVAAGRRIGLAGALAPALVWLSSSTFQGAKRAEGDLVVPATLPGYAYLVGGLLLWAAVVLHASAASRPDPRPSPATPGRASGR